MKVAFCCVLRLLMIGVFIPPALSEDLQAQSSPVQVLGGRVVDSVGNAVSFASVQALDGSRTTARSDGTFRLTVPFSPATTLVIRQIGFHPESLNVRVDRASGTISSITVKLSRNVIQLPVVSVTAMHTCPASDTSATAVSAELKPIFDALQENVYRTRSILQAHPLRAEMLVTTYDSAEGQRGKAKQYRGKQTNLRTNDGQQWRKYEPGKVVEKSPVGTAITPFSPAFFVDSVFTSTHCFRYAGNQEADGRRAVRVDFAPNALVKSVDWGGSVLIDEQSYVLRSITASLQYPAEAGGKQTFLIWSTKYEEIFPGIVDLASDRRVRWTGTHLNGRDEKVRVSVIETTTLGRTYIKGAPIEALIDSGR